jgi:Ca2+-binding EF-hand superfamily protein
MMFAAFDRNGDGVLEREEFAALHAAGLGRLVLADWAGRVDGLTVFVFIDSNQDGVVSAAEFRVHARPGVR